MIAKTTKRWPKSLIQRMTLNPTQQWGDDVLLEEHEDAARGGRRGRPSTLLQHVLSCFLTHSQYLTHLPYRVKEVSHPHKVANQ